MIANSRLLFLPIAGIALILIGAQTVRSAVFNIPDGDITALKSAINTSNANGEDDTIELTTNGDYPLVFVDNGVTGLPIIAADGGHSLVIHGNGSVIRRLYDMGALFRIFRINTGGNVSMSNLTIRNGNVSNSIGGAIFNSRGRVVLSNCLVESNSSRAGGAIYNDGSGSLATLEIRDGSRLHGNYASLEGGAIYNNADSGGTAVTVIDASTVDENSADFFGGAIFNDGYEGLATLYLSNSVISANETGGIINFGDGGDTVLIAVNVKFSDNFWNGGIYNWGAVGDVVATVDRCTFENNSIGVVNETDQGPATLMADHCTFEDNYPGIDNSGIATIDNSTFVGEGAAGVRNYDTATITNSTFSVISSSYGIENGYSGGSSALVSIGSTVMNADASSSCIHNENGSVTSLGKNLCNDNGGGFLTAMGDQINTDPMLDPAGLQNNGGPTKTIKLLGGSPAINTGDPNAPARDQRYYLRNGAPDKGAYEYQGILAPTGASSRKTHGAAGGFDVDLPLSGIAGLESRSGGVGGNHRVVLSFATPVTASSAAITSGIGSAGSASVNGSEVTVDLMGVTNAQQITLTLSGVSDGTNTNDVSVPMRLLLADTNGNGTVNASDVAQTKAQLGQAVTSSNFRNDVNANGTINASDAAIAKSQVGTSIPGALEKPSSVRQLKMAR